MMFICNTNTVVPNGKPPTVTVAMRGYLNLWLQFRTPVLDRISNEVLEKLPKMCGFGKYSRQRFVRDSGACFRDAHSQIFERLLQSNSGLDSNWFYRFGAAESSELKKPVNQPRYSLSAVYSILDVFGRVARQLAVKLPLKKLNGNRHHSQRLPNIVGCRESKLVQIIVYTLQVNI